MPSEILGGSEATADQIFFNWSKVSKPKSSLSSGPSLLESDQVQTSGPVSGLLYEMKPFSNRCKRISSDEVSSEDTSEVSVIKSEAELSCFNRFNTTDAQTDIAGVDSVIVYGQPENDFHNIVNTLSTTATYAEKVADSVASVFTIDEDIPEIELEHCQLLRATASERADDPLVCSKCMEDSSKEALASVDETTLINIKVHCEKLGLLDIHQRANNQWETGVFRIHNSCRLALHEAYDQLLVQGEFKWCSFSQCLDGSHDRWTLIQSPNRKYSTLKLVDITEKDSIKVI